MALSRLEKVRDVIAEGLSGIQTTNKPGTSTEFYRSDVKRVEKSITQDGELPFLCVDFHEMEYDLKAPYATSNLQVFDVLARFEVIGFYGAAIETSPGQIRRPMETVGHPLMHDVLRWLMWNTITYRHDSDADSRWMIDGNFKIKAGAYDWDKNRGNFIISFMVRANATTRDLA